MISKHHHLIQQFFMLLSVVGYVSSLLGCESGSFWPRFFLLALIAATVWHILLSRCPHCNRIGGVKYWIFSKLPLYCIHCEEMITFKEDN